MSQQNLFDQEPSNGLDIESQKEAILKHLKSGRILTALDALSKFDCMRLGARIYDLREEGHKIETNMVKISKTKKIAVYRYAN